MKINLAKPTLIEWRSETQRKWDIYTFHYSIRATNSRGESFFTRPTGSTFSHITLDKVASRFKFLHLRLLSTVIRHDNEAFRERSSNRKNLKTPVFPFCADGSRFENGAYWRRWRHIIIVISLPELKSKRPVIFAIQISPAWCEFFIAFWTCKCRVMWNGA